MLVCFQNERYYYDPTGGKSPVTDIYAGAMGCAAIRQDKTVLSWGPSEQVRGWSPGLAATVTDVKEIITSQYSFCSLSNAGVVKCWGDLPFNTPATSPTGLTAITHVRCSWNGCAALGTDANGNTGAIECWGGQGMVCPTAKKGWTTIYNNAYGLIVICGGDATAADGSVLVWDASSTEQVAVWQGHAGPVHSVRWNPRVAMAASGCTNVAFWVHPE